MYNRLIVKYVRDEVMITKKVTLRFISEEEQAKIVKGVMETGLYISTTYGTFCADSTNRYQIVVQNDYIFPEDIISVEVEK